MGSFTNSFLLSINYVWDMLCCHLHPLFKQAVARGDLSQKVQVKVQGADLIELKEDINGMVEKLTTFAQEVTRVSLDVGTKGKLGGQAVVEGVEGTWQELTAVVNKLAENLTTQVRVSSNFRSSLLAVTTCQAFF